MATLKQSTAYNRVFRMALTGTTTGATGKTVTVQISKSTAAFANIAATGGTATEIGLGAYYAPLTNTDTNTSGDLAFNCTASGCDPTAFVDQVQTTIFTDLTITGAGRVFINSGVTKNTALALPFTMTVNGVPTAGLTVTGQRNFGSGWSNISGTITDLTLGCYLANLTAPDTNSPSAMYRFTANGADDRDIALQFDP